ncbi:TMV resistance protein N [Rosa sericea]
MTTQFGSPSFSSSSRIQSWKYDVYLSFRGEDTRNSFTGHLYKALIQKGYKTFLDDKTLWMGESISKLFNDAIEESRAFIIIFSEGYASSRWCLDELFKILQYQKSDNRLVLPVFYKVKPSDVRTQRGPFADAFAKHEERFGDSEDMVSRWRAALVQAANLAGLMYSHGSESELIDQIVQVVSNKLLDHIHAYVAKYPVGLESRVQDVAKLVGFGEYDVHMVGIWGTAGIGKTTVAKAVYNSFVHMFESSCFLDNVRERSLSYEGLLGLQNILISQVLRGEELKLTNVDQGISVIKKRLSQKKVLLVLDDVNQSNQLEKLAGGSNWFGLGSRVIITTQDKHLLLNNQVKPIYKVRELNRDESFHLFSCHAFHRTIPMTDYEELASCVVQYAQGHPLALVVLGSGLCGRTIEEWQEAKDSNWRFYNRDLLRTLKSSYDALDDSVKEVFLDLACFFTGENKNYVIQILEGGDLNPKTSISVLQEKALINISEENHILMHNLLEQMGKEIIYNESPNDPSKRSRLWFADDVYNVLTEGMGTDKIKGIMVKLSEPDEIVLSPASFSGMKNLKYFINCNASFSGDVIDYLPNELRLIDWPGFPFQSFPANFIPKKLVRLNMPRSSRLSRLGERFKRSKSLKYINLESCPLLTEVPDFSGFSNLKDLNLNECSSLVQVGASFGVLDQLLGLSLSGCNNLTSFPKEIALKSVEYINLRGCKMLQTFPEIVAKTVFLTSLDLSGTAIKELPSSIAYLSSLEELTIRECENLTDLPCSIFELQHLWCLDLQGCSKLVTIPKWSAESVTTKSPDLCYLNLRGCNRLQEIPELPPKVNLVNAADCTLLERFAKLSNILERKESRMMKCITLFNCQKLCVSLAHGVTEIEHILLDKICSLFLSCMQSEFHVVFPGREVPKWFDHREDLKELGNTSEFSFEIPRNFKQENKGLAICTAAATFEEINSEEEFPQNNCSFTVRIDIDAESSVARSFNFEAKDMQSAHVWLLYIPFIKFAYCKSPPFACRVRLGHTSQGSVRCKSYGVHLVIPEAESEDEDIPEVECEDEDESEDEGDYRMDEHPSIVDDESGEDIKEE